MKNKKHLNKLILLTLFVFSVLGTFMLNKKTSEAACSHRYTAKRTTSATCTGRGYTETICASCRVVLNTTYTSALGHSWNAATCSIPMQCTRCKAVSGQPLGHKYSAATCTSAKKCTRCGGTSGSSLGHSYSSATCTSPKKCTRCNVTSGSSLGHSYSAATCTSPKKCTRCNVTSGSSLGHSYSAATCTSPKKCTRCGTTSGSALNHSYSAATCTSPKKCTRCGVTSGSALNHSYSAATCTSAKKCTRCGVTSGSSLGHSYSAATCTSAKRCSRCGVTSGSALGHNYTATVGTKRAATCTTMGIAIKKCSRCTSTTEVNTSVLGHLLSTTAISPTCTTQGYTHTTCSRSGCSYSAKSAYVSALGHNYTTTVGTKRAATCTTMGIAIKKCSRCTSTTEVNTSVLGHLLSSKKVSPTCTAQGYTLTTCSRSDCSYSAKSAYVSVIPHSYTVTVGTKRAAACTSMGIDIVKCSGCTSTTETNTPALGHSLSTKKVSPTCTEQGYTLKSCGRSGCSYSEKSAYVSVIPHSYTVTVGTKTAATCTSMGIDIVKCSGCISTTETNTPALEHSLSTKKVSPTCTTQGYTLTSCGRNGCNYAIKSAYVDALKHDYSVKVGTKTAATCTSKGIDIVKCSRCTSTTEENTSVLGHLLSASNVDATCTTSGYVLTSCGRDGCSYSVKSIYADPIGHDYSIDAGTKKSATCETMGIVLKKCSKCPSMTEANTPALNHIYTSTIVDPTCETEGYTLTTCERSGCEYSEKVFTEKLPHEWGLYTAIGEAECSSCGTKVTWEAYVNNEGVEWGKLSKHEQMEMRKDYLKTLGFGYNRVNILCEMSEKSDIINPIDVDALKAFMDTLDKASSIYGFEFGQKLSDFIGYATLAGNVKDFFDNASPTYTNIEDTLTSVINLSSTLFGYLPIVGDTYSEMLSSLAKPLENIINYARKHQAELDELWLVSEKINITDYKSLLDVDTYNASIEIMKNEVNGKERVDMIIYYGLVEDAQKATGMSFEEILDLLDN